MTEIIEKNAKRLYKSHKYVSADDEHQYDAYIKGAEEQCYIDIEKFAEFLKSVDGQTVNSSEMTDMFKEFIKLPTNTTIDSHFTKLTFDEIRKIIKEKQERCPYHNSAECIIPYYYKENENSEIKVYGAYGNIYIYNEDTIRVMPAREFPSGEVNKWGHLCYEYKSYDMPDLYSMENISPGYHIGMSMGMLIDMVHPEEKMTYIYDLCRDKNTEKTENSENIKNSENTDENKN